MVISQSPHRFAYLREARVTNDHNEVAADSWLSKTDITRASVEYFSALVAAFRRMDDLEGGSVENLKQAGLAVSELAVILKKGRFVDAGIANQVEGLFAQLAQIAGWMAYDAERHGLARRYFRAGLQAASEVGDRDLGAHILACMTYQAVYQHKHGDAKELAAAAVEASRGAHPAVRSLVASRLAYTSAARGSVDRFRIALEQAQNHHSAPDSTHDRPDWLYWYSKGEFDAQQAHSLLVAVLASERGSAKFVTEAECLLSLRISDPSGSPRDAFFHGAWLARAHVKRGDLHRGLELAETAVGSMPAAVSPRTRGVLRDLDHDLANLRQGSKLPEVRALRERLQPALTASRHFRPPSR